MCVFFRLSRVEQDIYLATLLGEECSSDNISSDSDDEDWLPGPQTDVLNDEISDTDQNIGQNRISEAITTEESKEDDEDDTNTEGEDSNASQNVLAAKDGTIWNKEPPFHHQTPSYNIIRERNGPHRSTQMLSIRDTFNVIFSNEIVDIIVRHTNRKATAVYEKFNSDNPTKWKTWKSLTTEQLSAFIGILITAGVNNSNVDHIYDMWKSTSYPLYRAAMGVNRFRSILRFIGFDNANNRTERAAHDKAAPIRDIWVMLNANLAKAYKPSANLTVDEQLFPYRGRTRFTQYMPSKPVKYGIKIWWLCDSKNSYPLSGQSCKRFGCCV